MDKLMLAQVNPKVGDVAGNVRLVLEAIAEAEEGSLVLFPEMVVTGYPLEDLALSTELQDRAEAAGEEIANAARRSKIDVVFGQLLKPLEVGGLPRNGVVHVTSAGKIETAAKMALPTYGVFDEKRLFQAGSKLLRFTYGGSSVAVLVCEDVWDSQAGALQELEKVGADVLLIINGSPFDEGKLQRRFAVVESARKLANAQAAVYVNLVGGQDDLVFDGRSFALQAEGSLPLLLPAFKSQLRTISWSRLLNPAKTGITVAKVEDNATELAYRAAVTGLRDYVRKSGMTSVLLGVSGGIDSALVATMAADALGGENVYGVSMPSEYSSEGSVTDAEELMRRLGGHYRQVAIKEPFDSFMGLLKLEGLAEENLQARLRGVILMGVSNQEGQLVLAPGNKSELAVGYSTVYGDAVGGYAPIKDVYKTDVYRMAAWRNTFADSPIPEASLTKAPSAELRPGQEDQQSLPPYELLDEFLKYHLEQRLDAGALGHIYGEKLTQELLAKINRAEWKRRQFPIGPKLTLRSFGRERFVPIVR